MGTPEYWPQRLVSPVWVSVRKAGSSGIPECVYDKAAQYEPDVCRAMRDFQTLPGNDLFDRFSLPKAPGMEAAIRDKVRAVQISACAIGESLYAALDLDLSASLTEEEFDAFTGQMEEQYRDGWGAEFEILSILTAQGEGLAVRLSSPDLAFCTPETVSEQIRSQEYGQTM